MQRGATVGIDRQDVIHPPMTCWRSMSDGCTPLHPPAASYEHEFAKSLAFRANERVSVEGDKYSCCCCCCRSFCCCCFYCCGDFFLTVGRLALISNPCLIHPPMTCWRSMPTVAPPCRLLRARRCEVFGLPRQRTGKCRGG